MFRPGPWVGAVHPINKPDYQGGSADIQEYGRQQDGSDGRQQDGSDGRQQDGLADTVTEAASANFEPNNQLGSLTPSGAHGGGPPSHSTPPTSPTKQKRTKFYAVTVGKRCGVFQRWYFILNFSMHGSLTVESRTYVSALTSGTPGATFQGFNSLEEAEDEYFAVKALGHVKVVRVPGDELIYGPLSDAKM